MEKKPTTHSDPQMDIIWIQMNQEYLWEHLAGMWIAVEDQQLISVGDSAHEVHEDARRKGFPNALITAVRRREYQGVKLIRRT